MNMRRIFVMSLAAITLLMTSCGGETLEEPLSQEYESFIGKFNSLGGITVDKSITHLFEDEDGNIYYAYSDRYDLDDELSSRIEAYGLVMEYESLDKPSFKVTRITEAPEVEEAPEEVTMVNYTDTDLGFSLSYPDNWTFDSSRDSIELTSPIEEPMEDSDEEPMDPDVIIVALLDAQLRTTSDDEMDARATDVKTQVAQLYVDLGDDEPQVTMIGIDQQFALRYKTDGGDVHYFIPQGNGLLELSLYHPSEESALDNSNIFSEVVSSFRLLPTGDDGEFITEQPDAQDPEEENDETNEEEEVEEITEEEEIIEVEEEVEEIEEETQASNADGLIANGDFREFESNPYKFKMSYPKNWYYSGGNQGYDFSTDPIEDETEALIRMDINASQTTGVTRTSTQAKITVEVDGQYYTLTGPLEYEDVMQSMANSIMGVKLEEA